MADVTGIVLPPITQGATWNPPGFTILVGGVAVNLTTYTGIWEMALGPLPLPVVQACQTSPPGNGLLVLGAAGSAVITLAAGMTTIIPVVGLQQTYQWELKLIDGSGIVSKPLAGTVVVNATIAV